MKLQRKQATFTARNLLITTMRAFDALLELSIEEWGLRLIDQRSEYLVPYMIIEIKLTDQKGKILWKEKEIEVGRSAHAFSKYLNQKGLLEETIRSTLKDAAYRIASTLLYS